MITASCWINFCQNNKYMKKIKLIIALSIIPVSTFACDICGCGVGSSYLGLLPEFSRHAFGLRYRYNSLLSHIGAGGTTTYLTSKEYYRTLELWTGWNIGRRFRIMASVPYAFNKRSGQTARGTKNGPGDITFTGYYQLFDSRRRHPLSKGLVQNVWIGGGIKLPTGKYNTADKTNMATNTNLFQLGTGSVDYLLVTTYDGRYKQTGLNFSTSYKINAINKHEYSYGNKFSASIQVYQQFNLPGKLKLAPNAGVTYENSAKDIDNKIIVDMSGGNLLMGTLGAELSWKKINVGANWQTAFSQNLAMGMAKAKNRGMVHMALAF